MTCGKCAECSRGIIQQRAWLAATAEQRASWKAAGHRMLRGHGLCANCYQRSYTKRPFPAAPKTCDAPIVTSCRRCGMPGVSALCVDCTDVATDLDEVARWVA